MEWVDCTGDVVRGDIIRFTETIWGGSYKRPYKIGERVIQGKVINDSYGYDKQQHTFTIEVLACSDNTINVGTKLLRKGRNVYRNGTERLLWDDESERLDALDEKHERGYNNSLRRQDRILNKGEGTLNLDLSKQADMAYEGTEENAGDLYGFVNALGNNPMVRDWAPSQKEFASFIRKTDPDTFGPYAMLFAPRTIEREFNIRMAYELLQTMFPDIFKYKTEPNS